MTNKEGYRCTLINPKDISRAEINVRIWELTYFYVGKKYTTKVHPGNIFCHSTGQTIKLSNLNELVLVQEDGHKYSLNVNIKKK